MTEGSPARGPSSPCLPICDARVRGLDGLTNHRKDSLMTFPASSKAFSSLRSPTKTFPDFPSAPRLTLTSSLCNTCKQKDGIQESQAYFMMPGLLQATVCMD